LEPLLIGLLVVVPFAALVAALSDPPTITAAAKVFLAAVAFFIALIGLDAVFGKTLGDFLRNVNGQT
jgi:hypothetical protein